MKNISSPQQGAGGNRKAVVVKTATAPKWEQCARDTAGRRRKTPLAEAHARDKIPRCDCGHSAGVVLLISLMRQFPINQSIIIAISIMVAVFPEDFRRRSPSRFRLQSSGLRKTRHR
jgi:hypothetical protein